MKRAFYEAVIVILIAVPLCLVTTAFRPQGIRLFITSMQELNEKAGIGAAAKEISIENAFEKYKEAKALFADSRSSNDFLKGHIKGALNLPYTKIDELIDDFISKTDHDTMIITYCAGIHCEMAKNLAEDLCLAGFNNVCYMTDGWDKWNERSLPIASNIK